MTAVLRAKKSWRASPLLYEDIKAIKGCQALTTSPCGRSCRKCLSGFYDKEPSKSLYLSNYHGFAENKEHKQKRFVLQAFRGVACGIERESRFRWFVLTESDEAISQGIKFGTEFHKFITWLRYRCPDFQYILVEHCQGISPVNHWFRRNWHILSYGSDRLPVLACRDYWLEHYKSTVTGMAEVRDIKRAVYYIAGYLSASGKFVRYRSSHGWVYRGWVGDNLRHKKRFGEYLPEMVLVQLSRMSKFERSFSRICLRETGYLSLDECFASSCVVATA